MVKYNIFALSLAAVCSQIAVVYGFSVQPHRSAIDVKLSSWCKGAETQEVERMSTKLLSVTEEAEDFDNGTEFPPSPVLDNMEKAWRHVKKPMLRIGSKGAAPSHGNSLRELLEQHDAVKVKVNTYKLGSLEDAFDVLRVLAEDKGAPKGIELLQYRKSDNMILFGRPGTMEKIKNGEYPPTV